jgi:predicted CXXCH cytochrome family protein
MKSPRQLRAPAAAIAALGLAGLAFGAAAALVGGCSVDKHRRVLSIFFDGVPEPAPAAAPAAPESEATAGRRLVRPGEHGPYAAKLCSACHDAQATNALIAPVGELCGSCHELGTASARYVHGPLASGGCLVCHDPHRSQNRHLLVSASDSFCLRCHDRAALSPAAGHAGEAADCTQCHEAHMSDRRFLLRPLQ